MSEPGRLRRFLSGCERKAKKLSPFKSSKRTDKQPTNSSSPTSEITVSVSVSTDVQQLDALPALDIKTIPQAQKIASPQSTTTTASASPAAKAVDATNSPPAKIWYSERTPIWNDAVEQWQKDPATKDQHLMLEKLMKSAVDAERPDFLPQPEPSAKHSSHGSLRAKLFFEPTLNAARGIVMPLANLDPFKAAPLFGALVFFGLTVSVPHPFCDS